MTTGDAATGKTATGKTATGKTATGKTATIEAHLERQRAELEAKLERLARPPGDRGSTVPFGKRAGDHTSAIVDGLNDIAAGRSLECTLADVEAALTRLRQGTYGRCERCGEQISSERLAALLTARTCVACASSPTGRGLR